MYKRRMRFGEMIKRLFFALILGFAALLGGSKFYIEYQVKNFLDEIAQDTAAIGEFRYLTVYSSFDGRLGVKGIGFYPSAAVDMAPIIVDEVVLSIEDLIGRGGPTYAYRLRATRPIKSSIATSLPSRRVKSVWSRSERQCSALPWMPS